VVIVSVVQIVSRADLASVRIPGEQEENEGENDATMAEKHANTHVDGSIVILNTNVDQSAGENHT